MHLRAFKKFPKESRDPPMWMYTFTSPPMWMYTFTSLCESRKMEKKLTPKSQIWKFSPMYTCVGSGKHRTDVGGKIGLFFGHKKNLPIFQDLGHFSDFPDFQRIFSFFRAGEYRHSHPTYVNLEKSILVWLYLYRHNFDQFSRFTSPLCGCIHSHPPYVDPEKSKSDRVAA